MSLLDEAKAAQRQRGPQCQVATVLANTAGAFPKEITDLLAAVTAKEVYASTASEVLKRHQIELSRDSIRRHVNRHCQCR